MTTYRYHSNFRKEEIELLGGFITRGLSSVLVGVAGVGKSNIMEFIRHQYTLPSDAAEMQLAVNIISLDCSDWNGTPTDFWHLLRQEAEHDLGVKTSIVHMSDRANRDFQVVRDLVSGVCDKPGGRLAILFDDADCLLHQGPVELLEQLCTLRSYHRDTLSFLLFTKGLPHLLGEPLKLRKNSRFYELFSSRIFTLQPYVERDSVQMLNYLNAQDGRTLQQADIRMVLHLSGGHATLLRKCFDILTGEHPERIMDALLNNPDIQNTCSRVLNSLYGHERAVLVKIAKRTPVESIDMPALVLLQRRGLLIGSPPTIFSPVLEGFVQLHSSKAD